MLTITVKVNAPPLRCTSGLTYAGLCSGLSSPPDGNLRLRSHFKHAASGAAPRKTVRRGSVRSRTDDLDVTPTNARNADLRPLLDDGYVLDVVEGTICGTFRMLRRTRPIARGLLVSTLELAGDATIPPTTHTTFSRGISVHVRRVAIESFKHGAEELSWKGSHRHHPLGKPKRATPRLLEKMTNTHPDRVLCPEAGPTVTAQTKRSSLRSLTSRPSTT